MRIESGLPGRSPLKLTDSCGNTLVFNTPPTRVACLFAGVTEIIVRFGKKDVLVGLTRQDMLRNSDLEVEDLGSYFDPDMDALARCKPDLIIAGPSHEEILRTKALKKCPVMVVEIHSLEKAFSMMEDIGSLFHCEQEARDAIEENKSQSGRVHPMHLFRKNIRSMVEESRCGMISFAKRSVPGTYPTAFNCAR